MFTFEDWAAHRSANRYKRHLDGLFTYEHGTETVKKDSKQEHLPVSSCRAYRLAPYLAPELVDSVCRSRIVWGLSRPLLTVVGISLLLTAYHAFYEVSAAHQWPDQALELDCSVLGPCASIPLTSAHKASADKALTPHGCKCITCSVCEASVLGLQAHALPPGWPALSLNTGDAFNQTSFALSLLLVFRTNTSYSRWEEARKAWGSLANRARDFARQVCTRVPDARPRTWQRVDACSCVTDAPLHPWAVSSLPRLRQSVSLSVCSCSWQWRALCLHPFGPA